MKRVSVFPRLLFGLLFLFLLPPVVSAWGGKGHRIIARIAERHLTEKTRNALRDNHLLDNLPDGVGACPSGSLADKLACVANWADDVRRVDQNPDFDFPKTYDWHFVDIESTKNSYNPQNHCKDKPSKGVCGLLALETLRQFLMNGDSSFVLASFKPKASRFDRRNAVRFIVHLVGDLHQPLHTLADGGGANSFSVTYLDLTCAKWNSQRTKCIETNLVSLHQVWDSDMINTLLAENHKNDRQYADQLIAQITNQDVQNYLNGTPTSWVESTHRISIDGYDRYKTLTKKKATDGNYYPNVDKAYVDKFKLDVERQLKMAGVRLASVLNSIFDN